MSEPKDDPVAPFSRAILELYRDELRQVRFPDLDHDSLVAAAEELNAAQLEVECIEAALASARELVRERARELSAQATRGLSYARIFAAGNSALSQRIAQIDLLAPERAAANAAAPAKKRGRPRLDARELSQEGADEGLFATGGGAREEEARQGKAEEAAA